MGKGQRTICIMSLQNKLYKAILQKKKELEIVRKNGGKVNEEWDLPCMAVGCEYNGVEGCGFSFHSKYISRPDIIMPFSPLLANELMKQALNIPKLPFVLFKKKGKPILDQNTGKVIRYKRVVEKFIGTCAEDNAANCVLYELNQGAISVSLKALSFIYPIRTRTLKRERMCGVCRTIFTEP